MSCFSLRDGVDVVVVGAMNHSVLAQAVQSAFHLVAAQLALQHRSDVVFVDKAVVLAQLLHDSQNRLLLVPAHHARRLPALPGWGCRGSEVFTGKGALLPDAAGDKDLKQVVGDLVKLVCAGNVSAYDGLFLLKNADCPVHLYVVNVPTHT